MRNGLVLTGGGARAAYQVGVLRALADLQHFDQNPFSVISGVSAGAINGVWLASHAHDFDAAVRDMWHAWARLNADRIFKTDPISQTRIGLQWLKDLALGPFNTHSSQITYFLDTSPLAKFLKETIDFDLLYRRLRSGAIHGISVTAANYKTGYSTTFYSGSRKIHGWKRKNRISVRSTITLNHLLASAAIPVFFPPVRIDNAYYGDGMVRLNAPLSAAIHMGADRLFVIGIHAGKNISQSVNPQERSISLGQIAGTILNGLFVDSLDADIERLDRINRTIDIIHKPKVVHKEGTLRKIPVFYIRPSRDLREIPTFQMAKLPIAMNLFLKSIGVSDERGVDLLSYLSFSPQYIRSLLELGYEDTWRQRNRIHDFFGQKARSSAAA